MKNYTRIIKLVMVCLLMSVASCIMVAPTIQRESSDTQVPVNMVAPTVTPVATSAIKLPPIARHGCILTNGTISLTTNAC